MKKISKITIFTLICTILLSSFAFANTTIDIEQYKDDIVQIGNLTSVKSYSYEENGAILDVVEETYEIEINNNKTRGIAPRLSGKYRTVTVKDAWTGGFIAEFTVSMFYVTDGTTIVGESIYASTDRNTSGVQWSLGNPSMERSSDKTKLTGVVSYSFRNSQGSTTSVTDKATVAYAK